MGNPNKRVTKIQSAYVDRYDQEMERKQDRKKKLLRRLVVVSTAFALFLGVMVFYHFNQRAQFAEKEQESENLMEEVGDLHTEKDSLLEEIDLLNDEDYVLDIARTNYFLSKKGELIFQVDDPDERSY